MAAVKGLAERICTAADDDVAGAIPMEAKAWCSGMLREVDDVLPGSLSALGIREMEDLGKHVGDKYLWKNATLEVSFHTSGSQRCQSSCDAFLTGATDFWVATAEDHSCQINDGLLRPYMSCGMLQDIRKNFQTSLDLDFVKLALTKVASVTGLPMEELSPADVHGAYYACQTDVSLNDGQFNTSFACGMLGSEYMIPLDVEEDLENFFLRGYGQEITRLVLSPLLRHITDGMTQVQHRHVEAARGDNSKSKVELFFGHDSTVLPLAALMELFDLGTDPQKSQASRLCPFSSRLVVEMFHCGKILVHYNGLVVRSFDDIEHWKKVYAAQLLTNLDEQCALPEDYVYQGSIISHNEL
ncbi:unnamed protein product [Discosporangium mesarthrocarpum]